MRFLTALIPTELVAMLILTVADQTGLAPFLALAALLPMAMGAALEMVRAA